MSQGHESEFHAITTQFAAILSQKEYGRSVVVADEAEPLRFYAVHHWNGVASAELCHGDPEVQALTARLYQIARVTHVVNGVRRPEMMKLLLDDRRARLGPGAHRAGDDGQLLAPVQVADRRERVGGTHRDLDHGRRQRVGDDEVADDRDDALVPDPLDCLHGAGV